MFYFLVCVCEREREGTCLYNSKRTRIITMATKATPPTTPPIIAPVDDPVGKKEKLSNTIEYPDDSRSSDEELILLCCYT